MKLLKLCSIVLFTLLFVSIFSFSFGSVIYVNQNSPGGANGQTFDGATWNTAHRTIQAGIDTATPSQTIQDDYTSNLIAGDEIWVASGRYLECVALKTGVRLYGGFSGYESEAGQSNWSQNQTIIDGSNNGSVITVPSGSSEFTTISGFTICNGSAQNGGGIKCESASAVITNNIITGNTATLGGGLYSQSSSLTISCNVISDNNSSNGGAIYSSNSTSKITNNTITGNDAIQSGAGIGGSGSNLDIANNIIAFNTSGIALSNDSSQLKNNCVYSNGQYNYSGISSGSSDIDVDPQFIDIDGNNFHLSVGSPCIDTGSDSKVTPNVFDIDAQPRVIGEHVDIGVDECQSSGQSNRNINQSNSLDTQTLESTRIIYIKQDSAGPTHDGSSWNDAYVTIQQGINAAVSGDEIWVAADTYNERITLKNGVGLYGGFVGTTETSRDQRDWVTNETIIDGQDGGSVVIAGSTVTSSSTIDGFTIQNGIGSLSGSDRNGGGLYCIQSSPYIRNNKFTSNNATFGAGICCTSATPVIEDNKFESNTASKVGAGIYANGSTALTIQRNIITGNNTTDTTYGGSAGIYIYGAPAIIRYNKIIGNQSAYNTGGIGLSTCSATVANNIIANNTNTGQGGGLLIYIATPTVINNTIYGNTGGSGGTGIQCMTNSNATIKNNIVASNSPCGIYKSTDSSITLSYNCVYGNTSYNYSGITPNSTNISSAPQFVNTTNNDFHLTASSPCVNAGDDSAVVSGWLDIDGQDRINPTHVDIGADEMYQVAALSFDPDGGTYKEIQHVSISCTTPGASIYYTTDGSPPTVNSNLYSSSITIDQNCTLKAIGIISNWISSDIKTAEYIIDLIAPTPGTAVSPATASSSPIQITYTGASDNEGGSGLKNVELWFRKDTWSSWMKYGSQSSTGSGSFTFNIYDGSGTYYFDLVAEDNAGNRSAVPSVNGDCSTDYKKTSGSTGRSSIEIEYLYPGGPALKTKLFDENNVLTRQVNSNYGLEGELLSVTGDTEPVSYEYDGVYRVTSVTDGKNNKTKYQYDEVGNLMILTYPGPGGGTASFIHDANGNVTQSTDPKGVTTHYEYDDPEDLLTRIDYPDPLTDVLLTYDDDYGELQSITDQSGTKTFAYNNIHIPTGVTTTYTGLPAKTINYSYNPDGSLYSIGTPAGNFTYSYDAAGRPTSLTNPYSETTAWSYDNVDRLTSQTIRNLLGNTIAFTSYGYNGKSQLTDLVNRSGNGSILSRFNDQTYDTAGNLISLAAEVPGASTLSGTTSYTYNVLDQLTQELSTRNGNYQYNFEYDAAGNPTLFKGNSRTFNILNQNNAFVFNLNGNPTTYKGNTLDYDIDDNLTQYGSLLTAGYDSSGLRVWKQNTSGRTHFLYAGGIPVCELDASGNVTATNTFGANGLVSRRTGGASDFFAFDQQGSVTQQINSDGTLDANNLYDAYGNKLNTGVSAPFGYGAQSGYYTDPETGLMLLTHRYYDPAEGRFLTRDPIGYAGGMNLYGYCGGNPVNYSDPLGLTEEDDALNAWDGLTGPRGFLGGLSANWTTQGNDYRNNLLAQAGMADYACKAPLGRTTILGGAFLAAPIVFDCATMGGSSLADDLLWKAGRRIWDYRNKYQIWKGIILGSEELHHLIPQEFRELFKNIRGLSIDDPWWLRPLDAKSHAIITADWRNWSKLHPNPTIEEVLEKVCKTIDDYHLL